MKKSPIIAVLFLLLLSISFSSFSQTEVKSTSGKVDIASNDAEKHIHAVNSKATAAIDKANENIAFSVPMDQFVFDIAEMGAHFNDMAKVAKYTKASFAGTLSQKIDYTKDGTYTVSAKGTLSYHKVKKEVELKGTIKVEGKKVTLEGSFPFTVGEYNMQAPEAKYNSIMVSSWFEFSL